MNSRAKGEKSPVIPAFSPTISLLSYLTLSGGSRQPMAALMGNRTGGSISVSPWHVQAPSYLSMEAPHTLGPVTLSRQWHTTPYLHLHCWVLLCPWVDNRSPHLSFSYLFSSLSKLLSLTITPFSPRKVFSREEAHDVIRSGLRALW